MKTIDDRLRGSRARQPKRELPNDFSAKITEKLINEPTKSKSSASWKRIFTMKPAMFVAALLACVALGGSTYAVVQLFSNASLQSISDLPDGSRLVVVATNDCSLEQYNPRTNSFDTDSNTISYKIAKDSSLKDQEILQVVQGLCEGSKRESVHTEQIEQLIASNPQNTDDNIRGGMINSTVTAKTESSITIMTDEFSYDGKKHVVATEKSEHTFSSIDPDAVFINWNGDKISYADIQVGDHVTVSYRTDNDPATSGEATKIKSDDSVVMIIKNSENIAVAVSFDAKYGKDFTEVTSCDSDPSGYCDIQKFNEN